MLKFIGLLLLLTAARGDGVDCTSKALDMIAEIPNGDLEILDFLKKSGTGINDLGKYHECIATDGSRYFVLTANFVVARIYFGLCVPEICDLTNIEGLNDYVASALTDATRGALPPITGKSVRFYESKVENDRVSQWGAGAIITVIISVLLGLCVLLGTSLSILDIHRA